MESTTKHAIETTKEIERERYRGRVKDNHYATPKSACITVILTTSVAKEVQILTE